MAVMQQVIQNPMPVFIDKETTNKSFLDMHYYLKSIGIQNNDFFLALLDTDLRGVDPRDPNLPNYLKIKVLQETKNNYWYYLRTVVRIPKEGGDVSSGSRYNLHRGNLAMNFLFILNYNMFVELPRQHGKTVGAVVRYLWEYNFSTTNSQIMFIHKDHAGSKSNLRKLKEIRDTLPSYLQLSSAVGQNGKKLKVVDRAESIQNPFNKNKIVTFASARTRDAANNLGRGATMPIQYYDEFAWMPYNKEIYLAAVPAFSTASKNAALNGAPYGILLTTTPGDLLTDAGEYAYEIRNNATPWNEKYYDYTWEQLEGLRKANTKSNFFLIKYTYQQLGSGQDYFMQMVKDMGNDWPAIRREVMLEWAEAASNCPFSQEDLDTIKSHLKQPINTILFGQFGQYQFNIYEQLDLTYPPIIGVDVAGATYNDSSAITIVDSKSTRVTATLNSNFIPADDLADVIYQIVTKYMTNAVVNVERNGGFGLAVLQRLCKTSVKKNLYWELKEQVIEEAFNGIRMNKRKTMIKRYGLNSTKDVRARLIEILMERVMYHKDKFVAPILHAEMQAMEVKSNGKVEHSEKSHDDQVFSYLMALYVWYEGKNLADNFHIMKSTLRTDANLDIDEMQLEDELEAKEKLDVDKLIIQDDLDEKINDINEALNWVEKDSINFKTSEMFAEQQREELNQLRTQIISSNPKLRDSIAELNGVSTEEYMNQGSPYVDLPPELFLSGMADEDINFNEDEYGFISGPAQHNSYLAGNMAQMFAKLQ